jgi:Fur family transcriptional regulator, ferric uptake regulator
MSGGIQVVSPLESGRWRARRPIQARCPDSSQGNRSEFGALSISLGILAVAVEGRATTESPAMTHAEELKSSGLKATLPRIKILEVFQQTAQRHMSAEDVYKVLLTEGSDIGLATVYRVLMQFEQAGILSRNHFEAGKAVFELNEGKHHDHLVCVTCGRVEEFFDPEIERRQQEIANERGYRLQDHALALYVMCEKPDCTGKKGGAAN